MESPSFNPSSPSTPLHPASLDRVNRQPVFASPSPAIRSPLRSPVLKDDPFFSRGPRSSDVQGKVLQFNQLADALTPKRRENEAALRRAILGREEAESRMKSLEEENQMLQSLVEEGKSREMKVAQRLETIMEESQRQKESGQRANAVYEKEIRRARKETFKSSSALVKLQEDLKTARNRYTLMREEVEVQKRKVEASEQEAFTAQYKLVGMQEELEAVQQRQKLAEEERDTLRTSLKEEEIARIAAEGKIPLPPSTPNDEFGSPKKPSFRTPTRNNVGSTSRDSRDDRIEELLRELTLERKWHQNAQALVNFMKLECQLRACSCRRAEQSGALYVHNEGLSQLYSVPTPPLAHVVLTQTEAEQLLTPVEESVIINRHVASAEPETLIEFSPATGTFRKSKSPMKPLASIAGTLESQDQLLVSPTEKVMPQSTETMPPPPLAPVDVSESPSSLSLGGDGSDECCTAPSPAVDQSFDKEATPVPPTTASAHREASPVEMRPQHRPEPRPQSRVEQRSLSRAEPRPQSRVGSRVNSRAEPRSQSRAEPRSQSRAEPRPQSRARPRDIAGGQAPQPAAAKGDMGLRRSASPPHRGRVAEASTMRFVETSHTTRVPLADPDTPPKSNGNKAKMPFTPGAVPKEASTKMPFTPGATKTREEALQSIRRWREGNSRGAGAEAPSKARARSVTAPRRPVGGGSPVRRDISEPSAQKGAM